MIDTIQDLFEQRELYHQLLNKLASLEALLEAKEAQSKDQEQKEDTLKDDDLTKIKGIGKVISGKLKAHGIHAFSQIASLTEEELTTLEEELGLFSGKIKREDWVEQAKKMQG